MRDLFAKVIIGSTLMSLFACAPKQLTQAYKTYAPLPAHADFIILEPTDSIDLTGAEKLGDIIFDKGFGRTCDYISLLDSAKFLSKNWGANVLKINQHQPPTIVLNGPCHRIKATAFKIPDLDKHMKNVSWSEKRRLRISDFKADTANRPFQAVTASYIGMRWETRPSQTEMVLVIESVFLSQMSYFKIDEDSTKVLEHEQGHFDITELHARKLRKAVMEKPVYNMSTVDSELRKLHETITLELQNTQDKYDHDIYPNRGKQKIWLAKIESDLAEYKDYDKTKFVVKLRLKGN